MMEFDQQYIDLMDLYKRLRLDPNKEPQAERAFSAAVNLVRAGKVSAEAQDASRYL